jgi:hypothetical protein
MVKGGGAHSRTPDLLERWRRSPILWHRSTGSQHPVAKKRGNQQKQASQGAERLTEVAEFDCTTTAEAVRVPEVAYTAAPCKHAHG